MPSIDLSARVRQSARRFLLPDSRIAVALSGGVDSVVLLHLLATLRREIALDVRAIHVNHGLSPNACTWEGFCSEICAQLGVSLSVVRLGLTRTPGESLEAQARKARYAALTREGSSAGIIALAQHADDQAETVLLQLLRGAGSKGLAAMPEWRRAGDGHVYWRPLLPSTRGEIVEYAHTHGLRWIEDESNADPVYRRNFLRAKVLPGLEEAFPGYRTGLARAAAHAADAAELLDQLADFDATTAVDGGRVSLVAVRKLGALRTGNVLRRMLTQRGLAVPPGERLAEFIRQAFESAKDRHPALKLEGHNVLRSERGYVALEYAPSPEPFRATWHGQSVVVLPHGRLLFKSVEGTGIRAAMVPPSGLIIRPREGGERLKISANRPHRTLKNLMQEAGVPAASRRRWPLVMCAGRLVAIPGITVGLDWQCPPHEQGWGIEWHPCVRDPS